MDDGESPDAVDGANDEADSTRARLVPVLRERVYATLVGLATVALLWSYVDETTIGAAASSVAASMGALWLASVFADISAHRVAFGGFPRGAELRHIAWVGRQTLDAAVLPLLAIGGAALGLWTLRAALIIAITALLLTIVLLGGLATRGRSIRLPVRIVMIVVEVAIALLVVAMKFFSH